MNRVNREASYAWGQYFSLLKEDFDNRKQHGCNDNLQRFITDLYKNTKEKCECRICLDTIEDAETLKTGKCGHNFHKECIKMWKESDNEDNDNCPTCRNNY